jgi:NAD-dependent deacetylase
MIFSNTLLQKLDESRHITVWTGAGLSVESGVKPYRDTSRIWNPYHANELASKTTLENNIELLWVWIREQREIINNTHPSAAHEALYKLEQLTRSLIVITHTVDNLHRASGNARVIELFGNIMENMCTGCDKLHDVTPLSESQDIPLCRCRKREALRPKIVLEGESITNDYISATRKIVSGSQVFILAGSTGEVYPAAAMFAQAKQHGSYMVEINPIHTQLTRLADESLLMSPSECLPDLAHELEMYQSQKQSV